MPTVASFMDIAAPPEAVAAVLLDPEAAPLWTSGLTRLELVEGKLGEPGSVGRAHYGKGKRSYTFEDHLVSVTRNRRYVSRITGGGLDARMETTLDVIAEGTRMAVEWSGTGTRPFTNMLLPFLGSRIARQAGGDLERLRLLVETRWHNTVE